MTKKKQYQSPFIQVSRMEMEGALAVNTVHSSSHEGFSEDTSFHPVIDDGTDDDSPFQAYHGKDGMPATSGADKKGMTCPEIYNINYIFKFL